MCTGVEPALVAAVASAAVSAAGTAIQSNAQQKAAERQADARNAVLAQTQAKNRLLADEAQGKLAERFQQEGQGVQETLDPLQQAREESATSAIDRASVASPIPLAGNLPGVVGETAAQAQGDTDVESKRRAKALANTRSFGDLVFEKNMQNQATGRDLKQINSFVGANNELLPIQQDLAQLGVKGPSQFGNILGSLGSLGSAAAGSFAGGGSSVAPRTSPIPVPRPAVRATF